MDGCDTTKPKPRHRFRPSVQIVVAFVVVLGVAAAAAWHFRFHLLWQYEANRLELHDVRSVPDRPMPEVPIPDDWVQCRVGAIEFSLPPELADNQPQRKEGVSLVHFHHGSLSVVLCEPWNSCEFDGLLASASKLSPEHQSFTLPRFRHTSYQASADDFRWSMTMEEVHWHVFLMSAGQVVRLAKDGHTESFFRRDMDGIVHFYQKRAALGWQSNESPWGGYFHFIDREGEIDPTFVRAVCRSLRVVDEADSPEQPLSGQSGNDEGE